MHLSPGDSGLGQCYSNVTASRDTQSMGLVLPLFIEYEAGVSHGHLLSVVIKIAFVTSSTELTRLRVFSLCLPSRDIHI